MEERWKPKLSLITCLVCPEQEKVKFDVIFFFFIWCHIIRTQELKRPRLPYAFHLASTGCNCPVSKPPWMKSLQLLWCCQEGRGCLWLLPSFLHWGDAGMKFGVELIALEPLLGQKLSCLEVWGTSYQGKKNYQSKISILVHVLWFVTEKGLI